MKSGGVIYLDRHVLGCNNGAISNFKLGLLDNDTKFQYTYGCAAGGDLKRIDLSKDTGSLTTPFVDMGDKEGQVSALEAHNVACANDEVLAQFKLHRGTGDGFNSHQYKYWCAKSNKTLKCRNDTTIPFTKSVDPGDLKLHHVKCLDSEALGSFQLVSSATDSTKRQYKYTCCRY